MYRYCAAVQQWKCKHCGVTAPRIFNLATLSVSSRSSAPPSPFHSSFSVQPGIAIASPFATAFTASALSASASNPPFHHSFTHPMPGKRKMSAASTSRSLPTSFPRGKRRSSVSPSAAAATQKNHARPLAHRSSGVHARSKEDQEKEEGEEDDGDAGVNGDEEERGAVAPPLDSPSVDAAESADEKRVRLARAFLQRIREGRAEEQREGKEEDEEEEEGVLSHRLQEDADAAAAPGRGQRRSLLSRFSAAGGLLSSSPSSSSLPPPSRMLRGPRLSVTCTALSGDDRRAFAASKDGSIMEWDIEAGRRLAKWTHRGGARGKQRNGKGGQREVLALAASTDGRFLASGGMDGSIHVWDLRSAAAAAPSVITPPLWCSFPAHRSAVSSLAFRLDSWTLFSGSADRTVKLFDIAQRAYVETLFGHTQEVHALHASVQHLCTISQLQ